jgi:4-alpha-glucanotransferase
VVRALISSKRSATSWAVCPLSSKIWALLPQDVYALRDQFQLPGTRVLQFAFDGHTDNPYLPHNFVPNTVVYTGTHDNAPTREWYEELSDYQRQNLWNYLKRAPGGNAEAAPALIQLAWSSKAALAIAPLQDLLNLGETSRMNVPGRASGNWRWRSPENMLSLPAFEWLRDLTETSKRSDPATNLQAEPERTDLARAVPLQG